MKTSKSTVIALAAASMLMSASVLADMSSAGSANVKCYGTNSCRGQSACKTASNSCKGQNSCKGKGFTLTSSNAQCLQMNGKLQESK